MTGREPVIDWLNTTPHPPPRPPPRPRPRPRRRHHL